MPPTRFLIFMAAFGIAVAVEFSYTLLSAAGYLIAVYALVHLLAKGLVWVRRRYFVP